MSCISFTVILIVNGWTSVSDNDNINYFGTSASIECCMVVLTLVRSAEFHSILDPCKYLLHINNGVCYRVQLRQKSQSSWCCHCVNICGICTRCLDVLYANTTAQQFPPHFRAFPQLSSRKIPPLALAVARLSSVLCLWFHQDIVIQLYLAQWYSPDNAYIILHRWFPCLFLFFLSNWILMSYIRFIIRSSQTPRSYI